jgi:hypothetical protein
MSFSHGQRAMIYLVAKGLRQQDFGAFMQLSKQRTSQLLCWYRKRFSWSQETQQKAMEATHGGLDVEAEIWIKIEKLLEQLPEPDINHRSLEAAKKILNKP